MIYQTMRTNLNNKKFVQELKTLHKKTAFAPTQVKEIHQELKHISQDILKIDKNSSNISESISKTENEKDIDKYRKELTNNLKQLDSLSNKIIKIQKTQMDLGTRISKWEKSLKLIIHKFPNLSVTKAGNLYSLEEEIISIINSLRSQISSDMEENELDKIRKLRTKYNDLSSFLDSIERVLDIDIEHMINELKKMKLSLKNLKIKFDQMRQNLVRMENKFLSFQIPIPLPPDYNLKKIKCLKKELNEYLQGVDSISIEIGGIQQSHNDFKGQIYYYIEQFKTIKFSLQSEKKGSLILNELKKELIPNIGNIELNKINEIKNKSKKILALVDEAEDAFSININAEMKRLEGTKLDLKDIQKNTLSEIQKVNKNSENLFLKISAWKTGERQYWGDRIKEQIHKLEFPTPLDFYSFLKTFQQWRNTRNIINKVHDEFSQLFSLHGLAQNCLNLHLAVEQELKMNLEKIMLIVKKLYREQNHIERYLNIISNWTALKQYSIANYNLYQETDQLYKNWGNQTVLLKNKHDELKGEIDKLQTESVRLSGQVSKVDKHTKKVIFMWWIHLSLYIAFIIFLFCIVYWFCKKKLDEKKLREELRKFDDKADILDKLLEVAANKKEKYWHREIAVLKYINLLICNEIESYHKIKNIAENLRKSNNRADIKIGQHLLASAKDIKLRTLEFDLQGGK